MLAAGTAYFVVIERVTITSSAIDIDTTLDSAEDPGGIGWSIDDRASQFTSTGWTGTTTLLQIVVNGVALPAEQVEAPTVQVSNTAQGLGNGLDPLVTAGNKAGQAFMTGAHAQGYVLNSLGLDIYSWTDASHLTVTLNTEDNGVPGEALCTLSTPATLANVQKTFDAPDDCPTLTPRTTYFAVVERLGTGAIQLAIAHTDSDAEAPGGSRRARLTSWSIEQDCLDFL